MKRKMIFGLILAAVLLAACTSVQPETEQQEVGMPNPASVFCEENGGTLEMREDAAGGQYGVCIFPDGSECEEWAYFRGECSPGDSLVEEVEPSAEPVTEQSVEPTIEIAADGCKVFRYEELGYEFHYPADTALRFDDNSPDGLNIEGAEVDGEIWPMIYFGAPSQAEFRPPEGTNLEQWLSDNHLYSAGAPDERMPDVQIAGLTVIHLRYDSGSGQSYNNDKYYFIKNGQLYQIVILHTGYKEDWELYNHFLESIRFDD